MTRKRDYAKEYREYHSKPEQIKNRAMRNQARAQYQEANPGVDIRGKDIDHKKRLDKGGTNSPGNLRVSSVKANRDWRKGKSGY